MATKRKVPLDCKLNFVLFFSFLPCFKNTKKWWNFSGKFGRYGKVEEIENEWNHSNFSWKDEL